MKDQGMLGGLHPFVKLLLLVLLMLGATVTVFIVGMLGALPFFGTDILNGFDPSREEYLNFMRYIQLLSHIGLFVVSSLVFAALIGRNPWRYLRMTVLPTWALVFLSAAVMLTALPLVQFSASINEMLTLPEALRGLEEWMRRTEEAAGEATRLFLEVESWQGLLFNIFLIAIIPALGEEFIFRGIIQRIFHQWTGRGHLAVWVAAILFSAMHLQFFGFLPRLVLGVLMGYMFLFTGNIWFPVIAHFFNNALAVTMFYLHHNGYLNLGPEGLEGNIFPAYFGVISLVVVVLLLWAMQRRSRGQALEFRRDSIDVEVHQEP